MATSDVNTLILLVRGVYGQLRTVRSGVTVRIDSIRRSGADGNVAVLFGQLTKDGVEAIPTGGWPAQWGNPGPNLTAATALAALDQFFSDLVP